MSKRTYVCFACRTTERVPMARITRRCRKCGARAEHVYYKFRIPRRDDDRGWEMLRVRVREVNNIIKSRALDRLSRRKTRAEGALATAKKANSRKKARQRLRLIHEKLRRWESW